MKRITVMGLGVLGALALAPGGPGPAAAADVVRERSEQTLDPAGWKALEIENSRGTTAVRPSADGQVHLVALKVVRGGDRGHAERIADRIEVTTDRVEGRFVITVHYPQRSDVHVGLWDLFSGWEFPRSELRLDILAPDGLPLMLRSTSGDLATEGRSGAQTIETRSGDVVVRGARGPVDMVTTSGDVHLTDVAAVRLRTSSGDVSVEGIRGPLDVRATSGDVVVKGAEDSLRIATSSGDVRVEAAPRGLVVATTSGDVSAPAVAGHAMLSTSSGDIGLGLRAPFARVEASSMNGTIRLRLAPQLGCALDARTTSGTIDVSLPMVLGQVDRHRVAGRVSGGGSPVTLHTSSGDIDVLSGGS